MPALRQIALNGTGGAVVNVLATVPSRLIEVMEDESVSTEGLQVSSVLDNFATVNTFSFGSEPVTIPNQFHYEALGRLLGMGAQGVVGAFNYRAADKILQLRSATATTTLVRVLENE